MNCSWNRGGGSEVKGSGVRILNVCMAVVNAMEVALVMVLIENNQQKQRQREREGGC